MRFQVVVAIAFAMVAESAGAAPMPVTDDACVAATFRSCIAILPELGNQYSMNPMVHETRRYGSDPKACEWYVLAHKGDCTRSVDVPTSAEVQAAIQRGIDEAMKAWLKALETEAITKAPVSPAR